MSFICSPALEAGFSAANCSGIAASEPSSATTTHKPSSSPDSKTAPSRRSPSFPTYAPLTADLGEALLTWWLAGFRARTSALQAPEEASKVNAPDSGERWRASLARFDRDSSSWKTAQSSLIEGSESSSVTWPRSGMTADGKCYLRPTSEPRISGNASGYWPTPTADSATDRSKEYAQGGMPLALAVKRWPTPDTGAGRSPKPSSVERVGRSLFSKATGRKVQERLETAVRMFPTATATASKGWSAGHKRAETDDRLDYTIEREASQSGASGRLNPEFVEWLMGWPIGHTGLEPVATARCREWQQQHSPCWPPSLSEAA